MSHRQSKTRLRLAVLGALLLVANGVLFAAVTWPRLTRVRRAENRAHDVAVRKATLEALWARLQARKELVARNRADIERLGHDHLKTRAEDLFAAQREIEKLAKDAGLRPRKSNYSLEKIKGTDLVRCEVTLPLDGSYAHLVGFLSRIESGSRFIVIDQLALSEEEVGAQMSLKLSAIFKEGASNAS